MAEGPGFRVAEGPEFRAAEGPGFRAAEGPSARALGCRGAQGSGRGFRVVGGSSGRWEAVAGGGRQ